MCLRNSAPEQFSIALWVCPSGAGSAEQLGDTSGTGPFPAIAESRPELPGHVVCRPSDWPPEPIPLFVWGKGACHDDGLAYAGFLRQIASAGYIVVSVSVPHEERAFDPGAAAPAGAARDLTRTGEGGNGR